MKLKFSEFISNSGRFPLINWTLWPSWLRWASRIEILHQSTFESRRGYSIPVFLIPGLRFPGTSRRTSPQVALWIFLISCAPCLQFPGTSRRTSPRACCRWCSPFTATSAWCSGSRRLRLPSPLHRPTCVARTASGVSHQQASPTRASTEATSF
jgi:hypothetical protein